MPALKETLTIVVNGAPVEVDANENAPLRTVVPRALEKAKAVGQSPENWVLRDASGNELDLGRKIESFGFTAATTLFLSLRAGVGGH